jgi:AcrR family transcriptional regulator
MTRTYTLKRRAEQQAETRQRIVEAAVELHSTIGPARTTLSMIAEHAGVQRHTLYAHFPEQRDIFLACSAHVYERDPMPDASAWRVITDRRERLRAGLTAVYGWYERNADLMACVMRDIEHHPLVQEVNKLRVGPVVAAWHEVLSAKLSEKQRVLLPLALSYFTWRTLVRQGGLKTAAAVDAMVEAVVGAK